MILLLTHITQQNTKRTINIEFTRKKALTISF